MKAFIFPLNMNQVDAALTRGSETNSGAHRGIWYYDPTLFGEGILVGDVVIFSRFGEPIAMGRVTETIEASQMQKVCSRINSRAVRWRDLTAEEIEELNELSILPAHCRDRVFADYSL